ncbi:unnamed protein product [Penicillium viridicatum]
MSTTRYTVPIPGSTQILETREQLNDLAMQYPLGTVDDRNGGYYLLDHDATVLAIASDSLCEELDASMEAAKRYHSSHPELVEESEDVAPQSIEEASPGLSKRTCSHPRCHTHALCRSYSDCHVRPSIFLPFCEISWGILVTCISQAPNAKTIYALRVLIGFFFAVFWPTALSMIFNWYTPTELAKRIAFFNVSDAAGGMFLSALQAALYTNMNGVHGITGWQWLFIVSGTVTIGQGLLGLVIIPDSPVLTRAIWLTDTEKCLARKRMADFGANTSNMIPTKVVGQKLRKLILHPVTYFFLAPFALQAWANRANSYFTLYLKALEDSSGNLRFSTYQVNVIPMGGYALQILINLSVNALSDWKHWRWQISVAPAFLLGIVLSVLSAWPSDWRFIITFYFQSAVTCLATLASVPMTLFEGGFCVRTQMAKSHISHTAPMSP